jgi:hypothetical protein
VTVLGNEALPKTRLRLNLSRKGASGGVPPTLPAGSGAVTCGDAGPGRENVAHSNLDLAALVPAGDKENLTTEPFLSASAVLQGRQKRPVCGLWPGSYQRLRTGSIATATILHAAMNSPGTSRIRPETPPVLPLA